MVPVSVDLGTAPITVSSFWPPLKIITVGMERMPYSVATEGLSSVFSLTCRVGGRRTGCDRRVRRVHEKTKKNKRVARPRISSTARNRGEVFLGKFPKGRGRARAREARAVARAGTWTGVMHACARKYHVRASKRGVPRAPRGERVSDVCTYRLELSFVLLRQLVDERRDHAAGPAPGRPEVHEDGDVALEHLRLEGGVGHDGGGACFGSRGERGGQTTDGTEREKMLTRRRSLRKLQHRSASGRLGDTRGTPDARRSDGGETGTRHETHRCRW